MDSDYKMKKLLLMGRSGVGKTSMHAIIFANYPAKETMGIGFTVDINESKFKFMGNLILNLWDCGGQDRLMKHYFSTQREVIFKNVEVLIYVFEIHSDSNEDLKDYNQAISNLGSLSKNANIFVLIHKMDKIADAAERKQAFERKKQEILDATATHGQGLTVKEVFGTSIWDETLYKAWSQIVQLLIPNMAFIKESLREFCGVCDCDEVVIFEKSTFLMIAHHENKQRKDILKYERLSNIIKQFKLSCNRMGTEIKSMSVKNSGFTSVIQEFTENTYIMIVVSDPRIQLLAIDLNVESARKFFRKNSSTEMDMLGFKWKGN